MRILTFALVCIVITIAGCNSILGNDAHQLKSSNGGMPGGTGGTGGIGGTGSGAAVCASSPVTALCQNFIAADTGDTCSVCLASQCCSQESACLNDTNCVTNGAGPAMDALFQCQTACCTGPCTKGGGQGGSIGGTTSRTNNAGGMTVAGGAHGSGGVTAAGGTSGAAGATSSGGTIDAGGTGTNSNVPWAVGPGGYVTSGPWEGYGWTYAAGTGSTISPGDFSTLAAGSPLCATGSVGPMADYSGSDGIGINLNQAVGANTPVGSWTPTGTGIVINVSNPGGSVLRVQIQGPTGATDATDRWCTLLTVFNQPVSLPWSAFNTACWNGSGSTYQMQPLQAVELIVPGGNVAAVSFSACITSLSFQTGGGTGGTIGSGGITGSGGRTTTGGTGGTVSADAGSGGPDGSSTMSLTAQVVGAYSQIGSTCPTGTSADKSGWAMFLCPGGIVRAAGYFTNLVDVECGTFTVAGPTYSNCTDKYGCFPRVDFNVKDTLELSGQTNTAQMQWSVYVIPHNGIQGFQEQNGPCTDQKSTGTVVYELVDPSVTDNYCNSSACPQPGGSTGGSGSCGTDCDCGHCWYCESGTCRYGGEGASGCYRGCE